MTLTEDAFLREKARADRATAQVAALVEGLRDVYQEVERAHGPSCRRCRQIRRALSQRPTDVDAIVAAFSHSTLPKEG